MKRTTFLKGLLGIPFFLSFRIPAQTKQNNVIEFTPEMLKKNNFGLYIINNKADVFKNPDYSATVAWKLGYHLTPTVLGVNDTEQQHSLHCNKYFMSNFLTDGWACPIGNTYEDICEYLNNNPHGEEYRILTENELIHIIKSRGNKKQIVHN